MSLRTWIPLEKLNRKWLCKNPHPAAIPLIEQTLATRDLDVEEWYWLCQNPNALHLLEQNPEKIYWQSLSENPNAIPLLEQNPEKIHWDILALNPNAIHMMEKLGTKPL